MKNPTKYGCSFLYSASFVWFIVALILAKIIEFPFSPSHAIFFLSPFVFLGGVIIARLQKTNPFAIFPGSDLAGIVNFSQVLFIPMMIVSKNPTLRFITVVGVHFLSFGRLYKRTEYYFLSLILCIVAFLSALSILSVSSAAFLTSIFLLISAISLDFASRSDA